MFGYAGKVLRIDLSTKTVKQETLSESQLRGFIGGAGFGIKTITEEVPPQTSWDSPSNKLVFAAGPLSGTAYPGSGTICLVTKGVLTGGIASSQANGFFGAFLRLNGYDAFILEGCAADWSYLVIDQDNVEIRDGLHLQGLDTWELEETLKKETGYDRSSVFGIGPAGESMVNFASICGDEGHVAAHNGIGAVMGSKKLKAVVVPRVKGKIPLCDGKRFVKACNDQKKLTTSKPYVNNIEARGTAGGVPGVYSIGLLPIKNCTTNVVEGQVYDKISGQYIRDNFKLQPAPCFACNLKTHCHKIELPDSPLSGMKAEEPEYEAMASLGSNLGIFDAKKVAELANYCDRICIDINETGWVIGWTMECYEKGIFSKEDLYGLDLKWGNAEAVYQLLLKIASREEGLADILANGVKRASEEIGGEASKWAVYTLKGNTPRGHDHRANWFEHLDTCVSNTGTIEGTGRAATPEQHGIQPAIEKFDYMEVARQNAELNGRRLFEDCLGTCGFASWDIELICEAVKHATGWDFSVEEAMKIGKRLVAVSRLYNLKAGISGQLDGPSIRYGEKVKDGPVAGKDISAIYPQMVQEYYRIMGWDENGVPREETIEKLGVSA